MLPCGLLSVNKPAGMTSRQVVDVVQRFAWPAKAGHAGTLDPLAQGVLVICVGSATRLIEYVQRMPKGYVGTFLLGRRSPTEDIEGDVSELPDAPVPTPEQIETAARRFLGRIEQRPPAFSALKVRGRPAYKLARQGKQVELKSRPVEIYGIEVKAFQYPELVLEITCGGGTYIRSLGRDLAESLGTAAVMSALQRTSIGGFRVQQALDPRGLTRDNWLTFLQPPLRAVEYLPRLQLSAEEVTRLRNGLTIAVRGEGRGMAGAGDERGTASKDFAALDPAGQLVGILAPGAPGQWHSVRILSADSRVETRRRGLGGA
jgi:tRNA pseudouridine55 synthase